MTKLKTVNIKGKEYVEVNERLKYFRANYPGWSLTSDIISLEGDMCVIKATITDEFEVVRATGIAYEKSGSSYINKTSYIENCETSAWGRALGNLGIGIDTSVASAGEVGNAIAQQKSLGTKEKLLKDIKSSITTPEAMTALKQKLDGRKLIDLSVKELKELGE